jgi:heat shock protein HslJ
MRHLAFSLLTVTILLAGCSTAGGAASPSPAPASLDGRTFLSTAVQGQTLVPGSTIRLSFKDGQLGINAGCNHMGGAYSMADGKLTTGQMMMTDMACQEPLMKQDTWVSSFLGGAAVTLAGDTLTLKNGDVTMTLTDRRVADPDRPLVGTKWVVDGIITGDAVSSVPAGVTAGLTITGDTMQVDTGCNTGSATVQVTATTMTIGPMALTKKACQASAAAMEAAVVATLTGEVAYSIEADRLTITSKGGAGLMLRAAA